MHSLLLLLGGLIVLIVGGELLVRGAVRVAERAGMSPLLIGLTLVGFGTSTPELVTSVKAGLAGSPGIALGNIVGSNIANILLILGLSALVFPVNVGSLALRRDGVLVLGTAILLGLVAWFGLFDRWVGLLFIAGLVSYVVFAYWQERDTARVSAAGHTAAFEKAEAHDEAVSRPKAAAGAGSIVPSILLAVLGLVIVVVGGDLLVRGAIALARGFGISETVIGLTIVAVGTSMPEFVTSMLAAYRRHADVALGNILGSNIYNILGIGGFTALIAPGEVPARIVQFDAPVMIVVSVLLLVFCATNRRVSRLEGGVFVLGYVAYIAALWPR